jgi:hypothetical protein
VVSILLSGLHIGSKLSCSEETFVETMAESGQPGTHKFLNASMQCHSNLFQLFAVSHTSRHCRETGDDTPAIEHDRDHCRPGARVLSTGRGVFRIRAKAPVSASSPLGAGPGGTSKVVPMAAADRAGNPGMTPQPRADARQDYVPHKQTARFSRDGDREPGI